MPVASLLFQSRGGVVPLVQSGCRPVIPRDNFAGVFFFLALRVRPDCVGDRN